MPSIRIPKWGLILVLATGLAGCYVAEIQENAASEINMTDGGTTQNCVSGTPQPGPVNPIPTCLWTPAAGATPSSGSYIYLESDDGEWVGSGGGPARTYTYTSTFTMGNTGNHLSIIVNDVENWTGEFVTKDSAPQISAGFYDGLQRYTFHDPLFGGFDWWGEGRGCNEIDAWVAVDSVTYVGNDITAIDLRFEQICVEDGVNALHGKIHWVL